MGKVKCLVLVKFIVFKVFLMLLIGSLSTQ